MAGGGSKSSASKGGSSGQASNADLHDDEDLMARRKVLFSQWKNKRRPNQMIDYAQSPPPPRRIK